MTLGSPVAQRWSIRLLTGGLLVRIQPGEPVLMVRIAKILLPLVFNYAILKQKGGKNKMRKQKPFILNFCESNENLEVLPKGTYYDEKDCVNKVKVGNAVKILAETSRGLLMNTDTVTKKFGEE